MAAVNKSWQFVKTDAPLVLAELPMPHAADDEVLLQVKAAGLCHTDCGVIHDPGWMSTLAKVPITIGHEVCGQVIEVGKNVTEWKVGDRVGICPTATPPAGATGQCPGFARDGGFSHFLTAKPWELVKIPDNVSFAQGAAGTDAGMTSYHAVVSVGKVQKGENVGIIGFGGLGQIGTRVAVLRDANVYVAEINEKVWDNAKASGVKEVAKAITDFKDVKFDVIIDYAGFGKTTSDALDIIKVGGRVVVVGMGKLESLISTKSLILNQASILGSNGGTKEDVEGVYDMFATGKLNASLTEIKFEDIPESLNKLHAGGVVGRFVAVM